MNPLPTMQLRNERQVIHSPEPNGSQLASMADGLPMSDAEWTEYCALVATLNAAEIAAKRKARIAANHEAFEADQAVRRHNKQRQEAVNGKECETAGRPIGKPHKHAVVSDWTAVLLGSDGETVLREWRWDSRGEYWQEMRLP